MSSATEPQNLHCSTLEGLIARAESAGSQLCVATLATDGPLKLRLRVPDCLAGEHSKYVTIYDVRSPYGDEHMVPSLQSNQDYKAYRRLHREESARESGLGRAISYRFKRDGRGRWVFVTTKVEKAPVATDRKLGAIGVDLNADHLAITETDCSGNYVNTFSVPLVTYG